MSSSSFTTNSLTASEYPHYCLQMPEPVRERLLVEQSWALVEQDLEAHGIKFFLKIFEIAPAALQLFSFKDERPLESSAGLKVHAMLVMKTVGEAVAGLKDIPALVPVLVNLATRHADFSVKQEHFPVVGQALLSTLEAGLGDNWTPEVQAAWTSTWNTVVSVMEPALQTAILEKLPEAERNRALVQSSWTIIKADRQQVGIKFFLKIFEIAPAALQLFSFKDERPLESSAGLKVHAMLVMKTVGEAVAGLKDIPALVPVLVNLATRHADFSVKQEHFPVVGQALLSTFQEVMREKWTPEIQAAWSGVWDVLVSVMSPALEEASRALQDAVMLKVLHHRLVSESWKIVERDIEIFGVAFFVKVLEIAPEALQLFSFKDDPDWQTSTALRAHGVRVMQATHPPFACQSHFISKLHI